MTKKIFLHMLIPAIVFFCLSQDLSGSDVRYSAISLSHFQDTTQSVFWKSLNNMCGKSFSGRITAAPAGDTAFTGKNLVMHVRACSENEIKIPFFVGTDSSRTWVLTRTNSGILLKHDHRHEDGSPDKITYYGGHTSHQGNSQVQVFPADQQTLDLLPAAFGNVWWIEIISDKSFSYNLRRIHTERVFSVLFDLTQPVQNPGPPWGWKN
jgi:hypothetical protein